MLRGKEKSLEGTSTRSRMTATQVHAEARSYLTFHPHFDIRVTGIGMKSSNGALIESGVGGGNLQDYIEPHSYPPNSYPRRDAAEEPPTSVLSFAQRRKRTDIPKPIGCRLFYLQYASLSTRERSGAHGPNDGWALPKNPLASTH